jgi:hypothetical protein
MRRAATILFILLAGCDDRSSFDKQYEDTANEIQNRAARIDNDLNSTESKPEAEGEPRK